jgi:hypothetical protein
VSVYSHCFGRGLLLLRARQQGDGRINYSSSPPSHEYVHLSYLSILVFLLSVEQVGTCQSKLKGEGDEGMKPITSEGI